MKNENKMDKNIKIRSFEECHLNHLRLDLLFNIYKNELISEFNAKKLECFLIQFRFRFKSNIN